MSRAFALRIPAAIGLTCLAILFSAIDSNRAQDADTPAGAEAASESAAEKPKKARGRLPNYYRLVVDQKQREAIYTIQQEYAEKIATLKAQLNAMTKERNEKVAALLTPEQRQKVEQLAAEAKAKRERKKKSAPK